MLTLQLRILMQTNHDLDMSLNTLRARLEDLDYRRYVARRKPFLTEHHKALRLEYALDHRNTDWREVSSKMSCADNRS